MIVAQFVGGAACLVAAVALAYRAKFLGPRGQGYPGAPRPVRVSLEIFAVVLLICALWWLVKGDLPHPLLMLLVVGHAIHAVVMTANVLRQRGT